MNRLIIIGAGGHGKVVADIAVKNSYTDICFLDDDINLKECAGFPVIGPISYAELLRGDKIVAIGNSLIREKIQNSIDNVVTLIHPSSIISRRVKIGEGSVIMAGAVINSDSIIGKGVIINTSTSIDHDCKIEDFAHISIGSHLAGGVRIGKNTFVGAGSTIINGIVISSDCIIGGGALVINDIDFPGTYIGSPIRRLVK
ncbi:acetyltransferase [Anaerococcus tetradius]|uniref:Sugar O-acyltransferase, sialic acid O-acetyltransferase NeuD family n=1 Tax=Anaerococcus tetradius TaxID=33036 RepID=A0A133KET1_9FIRM|nr:acetyltransferase [Anaerococcus tetradius]KWZ78063.1 sugar O-acyltransferase, sialic acid O-acetyltransferase NeuD family [Anaerococcus tetradius]